MSLEKYRRKRRFERTPEPRGREGTRDPRDGPLFVVQKHAARRLHYDFRLELEGVLKSWAIPKGPCLDPYEKRLAVQVEDHPLEYGTFEGLIPEGEYGGGTVMLWDRGAWGMLHAGEDPAAGYREGKLKIRLAGEKLRGGWMLVRMQPKSGEKAINWLLIKERDEFARSLAKYDVLEELPASVASGQLMAQIKQSPQRAWSSKVGEIDLPAAGRKHATKKQAKKKPLRRRKIRLPAAEKAQLPAFIEPQLASLAERAPAGEQWLHEIKLDGYRLLCRLEGGRVSLLSRNKQDWTKRFPELAAAAAELPARTAWLDGELVALLPNGASNFSLMQQRLSAGETGKLVYFVFDLLYLDGYSLCQSKLEDRKALLKDLLAGLPPVMQYVDHLDGEGPEFFRQCCQAGLEGIISKRRDRAYRAGRTAEWVKLKCIQREEFVIGGYTLPSTAQRKGLGALLVGYYSPQGKFTYAGRVGTGFSDKMLLDLRHKLDGLAQQTNSFDSIPRDRIERGTHWVRPELVAQVEFGNWTADGILRHPSFQGLREDKPPRSVVHDVLLPANQTADSPVGKVSREDPTMHARRQEIPAEQLAALAQLRLTHPDRVLYPEPGLTKLGLATYYAEIAPWILPHLVDRPVTLVRCPEGQAGKCFYQKHAVAGTPDALDRIEIKEKEGTAKYLVIRDLAGLLATVQMGVLELHPWGARTDNLERPDRMIFDLDPDPELPWWEVVDAARRVHALLDELGLTSFVKTSGGKGLHIVVPLTRRHEWEAMKDFSQAVVARLAGEEPKRLTVNMSKRARRGKVYLDIHRNSRGATAVAPYSTRARPSATVSTPLSWDELSAAMGPDHFRVDNVPGRLANLDADPWAEIGEVRQTITSRMKRLLA